MKPHGYKAASHERWLVSYADFITLMFAFFVVLYASATADQKDWWKGSDSHGRSAKICSWRSSRTHRVLNAYAFWSDAATCLAINLVKGCKRSGRFAIYTMNSSLHLFSLAVLSGIFVLWCL